MPCSSSETGAGSSWESCCSALTAFFSPPPATSTRPELLRNSGSRNYTRGTRPLTRVRENGNHALMPSFGPSSDLSSLSATAVPAPIFSRGNSAGRAEPEVSEICDYDSTFLPAVGLERVVGTDIAGGGVRSPEAFARGEVTAFIRPEDVQQEQSCYFSATSAIPADAPTTKAVCSAASLAADLPASPTALSAATTALTQAAANVPVAAGAAGGVEAPGSRGGCNHERAATTWTPWRSWGTIVREYGVWDAARERGGFSPGASAAQISNEHTTIRRCAEKRFSEAERHLDRGASQRFTTEPHLSPAALIYNSSFGWEEGRSAPGDGCASTASPAEGDIQIYAEGRAVASLSNRQRNSGICADSLVADVCEPVAEEWAILHAESLSKLNTEGTSAGWKREKAAAAADDNGRAEVAPASVSAVALNQSTSDADEKLGRASAKLVVFYSPDGSPVKKKAELDAAVVLPSSGVEPGELSSCHPHGSAASVLRRGMPFAPQPQSRQAPRMRGGEENTRCSERPNLVQELAERAYESESSYGQMLCAAASTANAHWTEGGGAIPEQGSVVAQQPPSVPTSRKIICGSTDWAPSRPGEDVPKMAETCVRDEDRLSRGTTAIIEAPQLGRSLLTGRNSHASNSSRDCGETMNRTVATKMKIVHPAKARQAPVTMGMPLGCEALGAVIAPALDEIDREEHTGTVLASASAEDAVRLTQKDRTSSGGSCFQLEAGKRVGQRALRQRPLREGVEDRDDRVSSILAGDRAYVARRGRCQRPASWKRVRQTMEEGQCIYRGCDLISPSAAVVMTSHVERKDVESLHKRSVQRGGSTQAQPTAPKAVENGVRATTTYGGEIADDTVCSATVSGLPLLKRSSLQGMNNTKRGDRLFNRSEAERGSAAYCGRPPLTAFATNSSTFHTAELIRPGENPSHQVVTVKSDAGASSQVGRPVVHVARQRDMNQYDEQTLESAATALPCEQQSRLMKQPAPTKMQPLFAASRGEQYFMHRGAGEKHCGTREGEGDDYKFSVRESQRVKLVSLDEGTEKTGNAVTRRLILTTSHDVSAPREVVSTACALRAEGSTSRTKTGSFEASGNCGIPREQMSRTGGGESRRQSIGPPDPHRFAEEVSGDAGKVAAEETGGSLSQRLSPRTLPRQQQQEECTQESNWVVSRPASCSRPPDSSVCLRTLWPSHYDSSPEDLDEDEASRFFKRRRCSLLLWGGIRHDRGHVAFQRALRDAPTCAGTSTGGSGRTGGRDKTGAGESTAIILQDGNVERPQVEFESIPVNSTQRRCNQIRLEQQPSGDERPAEGCAEDVKPVREPSTGASEPPSGSVPDLVAGLAGASALFPSRLTRKRKRGVGALKTRLLLLHPRGASISKEDATLVDSLGSALTYEETQQLRRREQEQRRQEVVRRQEEARRKNDAIAAQLKVEQKDTAAAVTGVSSTSLPPCAFIFGSTKPAPLGTGGVPKTSTNPTAAVQGTEHTGIALERTSTATASTDGLLPLSGAKSKADEIKGLQAVQWPFTTDVHSTGQGINEQQQAEEAFQAVRPKLRIIRSPPSAGDPDVPGVSAEADACGGAAEPCDAGVAAHGLLPAISSERKPEVGLPSFQAGKLPEAFGHDAGDFRPPQNALVSVTPQLQMGAGVLPPEFGGASVALGVSGTSISASGTGGNASAFSSTTVATGTAPGNPFAFQRGGRGLRARGSIRRR